MARRVGAPNKFESPAQLIGMINKYLEETLPEEYTVTGLALALGTSRQTLDNYQKNKEFEEIISEAKLIVENAYELSLRKNGRAGDIFGLKNFGWTDKQEVEHKGIPPVPQTLDVRIVNADQ